MTKTRSTRESETRDNEMLDEFNMEYINPLSLPKGVAREGFVYRWSPKDVKGQDCYEIERCASRGWTLVPADRAPSYSRNPLNTNPLASQYFCWKDVILMERPERWDKQAKQRLHQLNEQKLQSLIGVQEDNGALTSGRNISSF